MAVLRLLYRTRRIAAISGVASLLAIGVLAAGPLTSFLNASADNAARTSESAHASEKPLLVSYSLTEGHVRTGTDSATPARMEDQPEPVRFHMIRDISGDGPHAPFHIATPATGAGYYLRLREVVNEKEMHLLLPPGEMHTVEVPLGTYEITVATGPAWYGITKLFGNHTTFARVDGFITFDKTRDPEHMTLAGREIRFVMGADGGLLTNDIRPTRMLVMP